MYGVRYGAGEDAKARKCRVHGVDNVPRIAGLVWVQSLVPVGRPAEREGEVDGEAQNRFYKHIWIEWDAVPVSDAFDYVAIDPNWKGDVLKVGKTYRAVELVILYLDGWSEAQNYRNVWLYADA